MQVHRTSRRITSHCCESHRITRSLNHTLWLFDPAGARFVLCRERDSDHKWCSHTSHCEVDNTRRPIWIKAQYASISQHQHLHTKIQYDKLKLSCYIDMASCNLRCKGQGIVIVNLKDEGVLNNFCENGYFGFAQVFRSLRIERRTREVIYHLLASYTSEEVHFPSSDDVSSCRLGWNSHQK